MKNIYKIIIATGAVAVIGTGVHFGTNYVLEGNRIFNALPIPIGAPGKENDKDKEKEVSMENFSFIRISEKGEVIQEDVGFNGEPSIKVLFEYILKTYSEYLDNDVIKIPEGVKVISTEIKTGTLYVNLSKEIMDSKMLDMKVEDKFMEALGGTLYPFSKNMGFRDFQILVEGNAEQAIFGLTPTETPRIILPW